MTSQNTFFALCTGRRAVLTFGVLLFVTSLLWAKSRDPFERIEFSLKTGDGHVVKGIAVLPKGPKPFPVVLYFHGTGGSLVESGDGLRSIAEQNLAAVGLEYDQNDQGVFDTELIALQDYLSRQSWSRSNAVAWAGFSLGAQRTLSFALRHPERRPPLLVRLSGGWVDELGLLKQVITVNSANQLEYGPMTGETAGSSQTGLGKPSNPHVLIVHGEVDDTFPVAQCRPLAESLERKGMSVEVRTFAGQPHSFGVDRPVVIRGMAEYCADFFGRLQPVSVNHRPAQGGYWVLPGFAGILLIVGYYQRWRGFLNARVVRPDALSRTLVVLAGLLAVAAMARTVLHAGLPRMPATPAGLDLARRWLVPSEEQVDFDWLRQAAIHRDQPIKALLGDLELADLQRVFFYPQLEESTFRNYVLSPLVDAGSPGDTSWRRMLWEFFYPRIRRETEVQSAADKIVRLLRSRLTILPGHREDDGVKAAWEREITDAAGFERIYVASLRSVGIAARLGGEGNAELLVADGWQAAPRPIFGLFTVSGRKTPAVEGSNAGVVQADKSY